MAQGESLSPPLLPLPLASAFEKADCDAAVRAVGLPADEKAAPVARAQRARAPPFRPEVLSQEAVRPRILDFMLSSQ